MTQSVFGGLTKEIWQNTCKKRKFSETFEKKYFSVELRSLREKNVEQSETREKNRKSIESD